MPLSFENPVRRGRRRPLRVGIMCHASAGGSVRVATNLATALARRGHQVHLFARTIPFGEWNIVEGVTVHPLPGVADGPGGPLHTEWPTAEQEQFIEQVVAVSLAERLDVLHFHYAAPFAFISAEVRQRMGEAAPVLIGTLHGTDVSIIGRDPQQGPALAAALHHLDGLTTVSHNYAAFAAEVFGLTALPQVIANFINPGEFPRAPHRRVRWAKRAPRIAHVSNFRPVKDPLLMAEMFIAIHEQCGAELWLIGDGPCMAEVRARFEAAGVNEAVHYWGLQPQVGPLLAQTDLLLMTSQAESFCLAALEAMACGVPVVAPHVGGLPEVVPHEQAGYLFTPGDPAPGIAAAAHILSDATHHRTLVRAARRHAKLFHERRVITTYEQLYTRLMALRPAPAEVALALLPEWGHLGTALPG